MTVEYLKRAAKTASAEAESVSDTVKGILDEIEQGEEAVARQYAAKFDQYNGALLLDEEDIAAASAKVSQKLKDDIAFAHRLAETTKGRVLFTSGHELDRFVLWDYVSGRRKILA